MNDYTKKAEKIEENRKAVEKVISGSVKTKKPGPMRSFKELFISDDARNVKSYILMEVLIPAAKKAISDIVTNGVDMILYGETGRSNRSTSSRVSYRNYYDRDKGRDRASENRHTRFDFDDIYLESRRDGEEVLMKMDEMLAEYGVVSVADLYDLVGITGEYTDNRYGWTNLRSAEVVSTRDGYRLKLPKVMPID